MKSPLASEKMGCVLKRVGSGRGQSALSGEPPRGEAKWTAKLLGLASSRDRLKVVGGERRRHIDDLRSSDGRLVAETLRFVGTVVRQGEY